MGTKSVREIVESTIATHLAAQTELSGTSVERGNEIDNMTLPTVIVSCESVANMNELPDGLGNYACTVQVGAFTSADVATAVANHRDRCAAVLGGMQNVTAIKTAFTSGGDATCYDVLYQSHDDSKGERSLGMMASYLVYVVLPA